MKKVKYIFTFLISFLVLTMTVNASASGSITISPSSKAVKVGDKITVTVKLSCSEALGSWQFGISYDSAYLQLNSGDSMVVDVGDGVMKSKSYNYTFTARKSGTGTIKVSSPSMTGWNEGTIFTPKTSGSSLTIRTQAEIEASYSKDNNLKNITVDGYELSPSFAKDVTEYTVLVPETEETVTVKAQVNDSTASVSGTGEIEVSSGVNKVNLVVTAQNGSTKTYTLNIEVKDLNPIEVDVNGTKYTVVKKEELLTIPVGYTSDKIKINDIEIPAFKSAMTGFILVGLKDSEGNIKNFIYDSSTNTYKEYKEIKGASLTLYPVKCEETIDGFNSYEVTINGEKYDGFVNTDDDTLVVIYAMNVETGEKKFYTYDDELNSFIVYNSNLYDKLNATNNEYLLYIYALLGAAGVLFLLVIALASKISKLKKMLIKYAGKKEEILDEELV